MRKLLQTVANCWCSFLIVFIALGTVGRAQNNPSCFVQQQSGQTLPAGLWRTCIGRLGQDEWSLERAIDATGGFGAVAVVLSATGSSYSSIVVNVPLGGLTVGTVGTTGGTVTIAGSSSGSVAQNVTSGSWTFTWPTTAGTNAYALTTNGSGVGAWAQLTSAGLNITSTSCSAMQFVNAISSGGVGSCGSPSSGSTPYTNETSNFSAASNTAYWINANSLTVTLPASPANNDWVILANNAAVSGTLVGRNGNKIMGLTQNMTIDVPNFNIKLVYYSTTTDWRIAN